MACTCDRGPGKFESEGPRTKFLWDLSMESNFDSSIGETDGGGWFALYVSPHYLTMNDEDKKSLAEDGYCAECIERAADEIDECKGAILSESSQGFVSSEVFETRTEAENAFEKIEESIPAEED